MVKGLYYMKAFNSVDFKKIAQVHFIPHCVVNHEYLVTE